ncbi:sugar phosphate isomerase/epimerase [Tabrizicola sp.]|uniref:sugar phosphate isomerase/epimerase family protein n=1 Tax=Tabrizicola sp. TaxID=2005166 RepID=UPI00286ADCAE|nr:sugar phosphate isomerase/epimerase [Tabrizicola sp.]
MPSYQLYSSRNFPTLGDTLTMLKGLGYGDVEGFGGLYADDAKLAEMAAGLKATGLKMPTAHFGLDMLEGDPARVLHIARVLGIKRIYCPHLMPEQRPKDGPGWRAFGARLEAAGRPFKAAGIGFGWHNHDFEFVAQADGSIPQTEIMAGGPSLEWEIDVAWVIRGGADPVQWIRRYGPRITAAHVKDIAPSGENTDEDGWADVGHGTVPWGSIMSALHAVGCQNFVMEHDNPADHQRFAKRSLASVRKV